MFEVHRKEVMWGGRPLVMETGKVARQADGAVMITYGGTQVLCTAVAAKSEKPGMDFFPMTVNYQEKAYAAGKIPGGFFKREARPTEKETLTSRLIDRPLRPLFVPGFKNEVLVMCTVLSHDLVNDPDVVAMIAASAALTISGAPFRGPIACARVGFEDGEYILNPIVDDMQDLRNNPDQRLDLVVAGTKDAVMMVESEAYELNEEEMLGAVNFAHQQIQPVIDLIVELATRGSSDLNRLKAIRGFENRVSKAMFEPICDAIETANELTENELPKRLPRGKSMNLGLLGQFLTTALNVVCRNQSIAPQIVGTTNDVRVMAAWKLGIIDLKEKPELASGWRAEMVGQLIEQVLDGTVAIRVDDPKSESPLQLEFLEGGGQR